MDDGGTGRRARRDFARLIDRNRDQDEIRVEAITDAVLLFGHAAPLGEPVASHGPFVMNAREEILQAIRDYQAGTFAGKVKLQERSR